MHLKKSVKIGEAELTIETGHMAKQADGAVVVRYGDTMLLVTAVSAREKKDVDFLPLTVEYQEKLPPDAFDVIIIYALTVHGEELER